MTHSLPSHLIQQFATFLDKELGLHYPPERHDNLIRDLMAALEMKSEDELRDYIRLMVSDIEYKKSHIDQLSEALTIGETYLFRDGSGFESLQKTILPELIAKKEKTNRTIRIWCAGCCRGDEPYSIAILLDQLLPVQEDWKIQILGTDINRQFLEQARKGIFRSWAFRNTPKDVQSRYFTKKDSELYEIAARIRKRMIFSYLNLIEDYYPSLETNTNGLDLILCNNTLMYFSPTQIPKVVKKYINCLLDDGYFIITAVEASFVKDVRMKTLDSTCNVFQKGTAKAVAKKPIPKPVAQPPQPKAPAPQPQAPQPQAPAPAAAKPSKPPASITALYEQGEYEACIEQLSGRSLNENEAAILIRCYANLGRLVDAVTLCQNQLSQNTLAPVFHFLLANVLQEQNKTDDAVLELKRALFLDGNYIMAHFSLAYLLHIQQKEREAEVHRRVVLEALDQYDKDAIVPGSEQIRVNRLREMTTNMGEG